MSQKCSGKPCYHHYDRHKSKKETSVGKWTRRIGDMFTPDENAAWDNSKKAKHRKCSR